MKRKEKKPLQIGSTTIIPLKSGDREVQRFQLGEEEFSDRDEADASDDDMEVNHIETTLLLLSIFLIMAMMSRMRPTTIAKRAEPTRPRAAMRTLGTVTRMIVRELLPVMMVMRTVIKKKVPKTLLVMVRVGWRSNNLAFSCSTLWQEDPRLKLPKLSGEFL